METTYINISRPAAIDDFRAPRTRTHAPISKSYKTMLRIRSITLKVLGICAIGSGLWFLALRLLIWILLNCTVNL